MMPCLDNTQNMLALVLIQNRRKASEIYGLIRAANQKCKNICYVCLSEPHNSLISSLTANNIDCNNFVFVDTISGHMHYTDRPSAKRCIFTTGPGDLDGIKKAVEHATTRNNCTLTIFDSISSLLIYQPPDSIVRFTHELIANDKESKLKKMFIMQRSDGIYKDESARLINDLNLFADRVVEIK